ncbi:glycosyltransferase family 4 protein [Heyndrickxia coagulans]|uniref:glycosyltransferase family 4 protein n=1 Tax=Heyndrickxia coagulans TaxID=1398 RepID=UPI002E21329C|nr:glycosyltransferase family 4 protein [Heyndrickxia coagulans]
MKIYNINSYYFSSTVHKKLEDSILKKGHKLKTFVPLPEGYVIRDEIKFKTPKYVNKLVCFNNMDRFVFFLKEKKILNKLVRTKDFINSEVLHAHSLFTNGYIAYRIYKKYNIPYAVTVRDTDLNYFFKKRPWLRKIGIKILKSASKIIFLSPAYKKQFEENYIPNKDKRYFQAKSEVIPNGIDSFWLENINDPKRGDSKNITVIYAGNIIKRKNLIRLESACQLVRKEGININLILVGKIIDKKYSRKLLSSNIVTHINRVEKEKLINYYRKSDIFAMPSITETFGLVYLEAMSQGLPIIYSKNQGLDGYFGDGIVGFAVNPFDISDLKKGLINVIKNYNNISYNCIKKVSRFSWDEIGNIYDKVYSDIVINRK